MEASDKVNRSELEEPEPPKYTSFFDDTTESSGGTRSRIGKRQSSAESRKTRVTDAAVTLKEQVDASLKALELMAYTRLPLTQINGQRRLGPPQEWTGPPPDLSCEVFVGKIPKNCYESDIYPVFSLIGRIYEMRLMLDFSGMTRGYCFVMYTKREDAMRAISELNQYEIFVGRRIVVLACLNNCRLYISPLPVDIDSRVFIETICKITAEVEKVAIYKQVNGRACYALVSYKTHRSTAMARRRLLPETAALFGGQRVIVEWAYQNIAPSNVFEESGTYEQNGEVRIVKKFVEPVASKRYSVHGNNKQSEKKQSQLTPSHRGASARSKGTENCRGNRVKNPASVTKKNPKPRRATNFPRSETEGKENVVPTKGNCNNKHWDRGSVCRESKEDDEQFESLDKMIPPVFAYLKKYGRWQNSVCGSTQKTGGHSGRDALQGSSRNQDRSFKSNRNCTNGNGTNSVSDVCVESDWENTNFQALKPIGNLDSEFSSVLNLSNENKVLGGEFPGFHCNSNQNVHQQKDYQRCEASYPLYCPLNPVPPAGHCLQVDALNRPFFLTACPHYPINYFTERSFLPLQQNQSLPVQSYSSFETEADFGLAPRTGQALNFYTPRVYNNQGRCFDASVVNAQTGPGSFLYQAGNCKNNASVGDPLLLLNSTVNFPPICGESRQPIVQPTANEICRQLRPIVNGTTAAIKSNRN